MRVIKPGQGILLASIGKQILNTGWPLDLLGGLCRVEVWWPLCVALEWTSGFPEVMSSGAAPQSSAVTSSLS